LVKKNHLLEKTRQLLHPHTETPYLAAQLLIREVLNKPRSYVLAHPDSDLTPAQRSRLDSMTEQIRQGTPLPYVIGHWEFYQRDFKVNPSVLIPRPETELLVDHALQWFSDHPSRRWAADIGTGSGCIAVSLAAEIPDLQIAASDLSFPALVTAAQNARRHGVSGRVHLLQSNLLSGMQTHYDLIISNLPYIPRLKLHQLAVYGREPTLALDGGEDGLESIAGLLASANRVTAPGAILLLEIDEETGPESLVLGRHHFPEAEIRLKADLSGQDRYLIIQRKGDRR
jgi:release factor glutamine methyltransferase